MLSGVLSAGEALAGFGSAVVILVAALLVVGEMLDRTGVAVLVVPIAIYTATALGVSPYPFAVAVLIAASAAYSTPVSTPVVTLVVDPGRYRFTDFVKVGVPLLLLTYLVTVLVAPLIFPFHPSSTM
jgi:di/tricarboxylate transporter